MEIQVCGVNGLAGDSIISIKAGSSRRQAQVSQLGPGSPALNFPVSASAEDVKVKIDVMRNLGSQNMPLRTEEGTYEVNMSASEDISLKLGVRGTVSEKPRRMMQAEDLGANFRQHRDYLEDEGVLKLMKTLLATVVLEQPEDPYSFMADQFSKSRFSPADPTKQNEILSEGPPILPTPVKSIPNEYVIEPSKAFEPSNESPPTPTLGIAKANEPSEVSPPTLPAKIRGDAFESAEAPIVVKAIPSHTVKEERYSSAIGVQSTGIPDAVRTLADLSLSGALASNLAAISSTMSKPSMEIPDALKKLADLSLSGGLPSHLGAISSTVGDQSPEIPDALKTLADVSLSGGLASDLAQEVLKTLADLSLSGGLASKLASISATIGEQSTGFPQALKTLADLSLSGGLASNLVALPPTGRSVEIEAALCSTLSTTGQLASTLQNERPQNIQAALSALASLSISGELVSYLGEVAELPQRANEIQDSVDNLATLSASGDLASTLASTAQADWPENIQSALSTLATLSTSGELPSQFSSATHTDEHGDMQTTLSTLSTLGNSANLVSTLATHLQTERTEHVQNALCTLAVLSSSGELENVIAGSTRSGEVDFALQTIITLSESLASSPAQPSWPENVQTALGTLASLSLSGTLHRNALCGSNEAALDPQAVFVNEGDLANVLETEQVNALSSAENNEIASNANAQPQRSENVKAALQALSACSLCGDLPSMIPPQEQIDDLDSSEQPSAINLKDIADDDAHLEVKATHQLEKELVEMMMKCPYQHLPSAGANYSRRLPSSFSPAPIPKEIGIGKGESLKEYPVPSASTTDLSQNCDTTTLTHPDTVKKAGAVEALLQHEDTTVRVAVREALMAAGIDQSQLP